MSRAGLIYLIIGVAVGLVVIGLVVYSFVVPKKEEAPSKTTVRLQDLPADKQQTIADYIRLEFEVEAKPIPRTIFK